MSRTREFVRAIRGALQPAQAGNGGVAREHQSLFESRDAISRFLFVQDDAAPVDLCFVLGCPTPSNMDPAIELFRRGWTPKILISGYGRNPYFTNRGDLVAMCFEGGSFKYQSWGITREAQLRGIAALARDFHGLVGEQIATGGLTQGDLFKEWNAHCKDLLK